VSAGILPDELRVMLVLVPNLYPADSVMRDSERPFSYSRWLELADVAFGLDDARKEQDRIKELIRSRVEQKKRIRKNKVGPCSLWAFQLERG